MKDSTPTSDLLQPGYLPTLQDLRDRDLTREYSRLADTLSAPQLQRLKSQGITATSMSDLWGPRSCTVQITEDRFKPAPSGETALIFPSWREHRFNDLVAFDGTHTATRLGRETLLGFEVLDGWSDHLRPLPIYRTPVTWLAHNCQGIVILDKENAWHLLWWFDYFLAEDYAHAEELYRILQPQLRNIDIQIPLMEAAE